LCSRIPIVRHLVTNRGSAAQTPDPAAQTPDPTAELVALLSAIEYRLPDAQRALHVEHVAGIIRLVDFELERHPRYADLRRLPRYAPQVCSENGEDGMIQEIFRRIGTRDRVFAEVGVGDGLENNTSFLLSQGWTGFWIEGHD